MNNPDEKATPRQTWALFCLTKKDHRNAGLTKQEASDLIEYYKANKPGSEAHEKLYAEANKAGIAAANALTPTPMVVEQHANQLDDTSPVTKQWTVPSGVCGFAWVNIRPATTSFARWLKKEGIVRKSYYGGIDISIMAYGQSMEKKSAHAHAMADYLSDHGITAYANERMD